MLLSERFTGHSVSQAPWTIIAYGISAARRASIRGSSSQHEPPKTSRATRDINKKASDRNPTSRLAQMLDFPHRLVPDPHAHPHFGVPRRASFSAAWPERTSLPPYLTDSLVGMKGVFFISNAQPLLPQPLSPSQQGIRRDTTGLHRLIVSNRESTIHL
jgi:hypothetical protein